MNTSFPQKTLFNRSFFWVANVRIRANNLALVGQNFCLRRFWTSAKSVVGSVGEPNDICHRTRDIGFVQSSRREGWRECRNSMNSLLTIARDENRRRKTELFQSMIRAKKKGGCDLNRFCKLRLADWTLNRTSASAESFSRYSSDWNYFLKLRNRFALLRPRIFEITWNYTISRSSDRSISIFKIIKLSE